MESLNDELLRMGEHKLIPDLRCTVCVQQAQLVFYDTERSGAESRQGVMTVVELASLVRHVISAANTLGFMARIRRQVKNTSLQYLILRPAMCEVYTWLCRYFQVRHIHGATMV